MRRMEAVKPRVSFADLQRMPDDSNRYELYDGEVRVVPSPLLRHQIVSQRVLLALVAYADEHGGQVVQPPMDLVLSEYDVLQPDLMYFGPTVAASLDPNDWVRVRPDLAIEVLSPSTARIDRGRKRDLLARYRVPDTGSSILTQSGSRCRCSMANGSLIHGSSEKGDTRRQRCPVSPLT